MSVKNSQCSPYALLDKANSNRIYLPWLVDKQFGDDCHLFRRWKLYHQRFGHFVCSLEAKHIYSNL